ncbi:MAG: alpha/beta fold hydrolase [Dichotomicrobium sp.]
MDTDTAISEPPPQSEGMDSIEIRGFNAAYYHAGDGPPVIVAHCSSASHKVLKPLIKQLERNYEVFAPDLIGYGRSDRWPEDRPLDPEVEVALLTALQARAGRPVHLVGHSYGAMLSLEAARRLGAGVASLTLIEPVSFHLLRPGGRDAEFRQVARVADGVVRAIREDKPRRAAALYMGFWMGRMKWWLAPARIKRGVIATIGKVAKEFELVQHMDADLSDYRAIGAPTRLVMGARTRAPAKAVIDILAHTLPHAELKTVPRAGHMSPLTHPGAVNPLVLAHLRRHAG